MNLSKLLQFIGSLIGVRIFSALLSLVSLSLAYKFLGAGEYGEYSITLSMAGILSSALFTPFAKHELLSRGSSSTIRTVQIIAFFLFVGSFTMFGINRPDIFFAATFGITQGLKEFYVEKFRVINFVNGLYLSYFADALLTLLLFVIIGLLGGRYWYYVVASGASSFIVISTLNRRVGYTVPKIKIVNLIDDIKKVYSSTFSLMVSSLSVSAIFFRARNLLITHFGSEVGGHLNYVLDLIQRPMALVSSSIITTLVVLSDNALVKVSNVLAGYGLLLIYSITIVAMVLVFNFYSDIGIIERYIIAPYYGYIWVASFVFLNRIKSTLVEMPLYRIKSGQLLLVSSSPILLCSLLLWGCPGDWNVIAIYVAFLISSVLGVILKRSDESTKSTIIILAILYIIVPINVYFTLNSNVHYIALLALNIIVVWFVIRKIILISRKGVLQ